MLSSSFFDLIDCVFTKNNASKGRGHPSWHETRSPLVCVMQYRALEEVNVVAHASRFSSTER